MSTPAAGEIYDLGYRHYTGPRLGRRGAFWALYVEGLRALFGIGRGARAKRAPIILTGFMLVPAVIQVAIVGLIGPIFDLFTHADYFTATLWSFALFCAIQTPELVTHDAQYRVLALYFSRALHPRDYIVARLGALVTGIGLVALVPHLMLIVGRCMAAPAFLAAVRENLGLLPRIVLSVFLVALLLGSVALTIAALVRRRALATAGILASWLLTYLLVTMVVWRQGEQLRPLIFASPLTLARGVSTWVLAPEQFVVRQSAPTDSAVAPVGAAVIDSTLNEASAAPVTPRRGRRESERTIWRAIGWPGWVYLVGAVGLILASAILLDQSYRRVET